MKRKPKLLQYEIETKIVDLIRLDQYTFIDIAKKCDVAVTVVHKVAKINKLKPIQRYTAITDEIKREICNKYVNTSSTLNDLSLMYKVSLSTVRNILTFSKVDIKNRKFF